MKEKNDIFLDNTKQPDFKDYFLFGDDEPIEVLPNFNTINILVGSNNSGKSRFMRTLMKQETIKGFNSYKNINDKINVYNGIVKVLNINWKRNPNFHSSNMPTFISENETINIYSINFNTSDYFTPIDNQHFENPISIIKEIEKIDPIDITKYYLNSANSLEIQLADKFFENLKVAIKLNEEILSIYKINQLSNNLNYFIPTLRTAHSLFEVKQGQDGKFIKIKEDIFFETISKNYDLKNYLNKTPLVNNSGSTNGIATNRTYLFTGLDLYNQIVNARNGSKQERKRFDDFEKFIGKEFFNTTDIDIVAQFNITEKHQNIDINEIINIHIGEDSRKLHDLGDGIQSLIILMYSIFLAPENTIIYIDEPELNLHPGMQRLFLEQITNNNALTKKNLTYVIATHSNHLLDLTIEKNNISIYSFSKNQDNKFLIKNVNAGNNELLRELGVNNSSVFLANSSIWVEGVSDRNYIKAFLIAYCNAINGKSLPKEDIDYAFLEYAGSNLVHYDFSGEENENMNAFALNNRIFILADNDSGKEKKHKKHEELCMLNPVNLVYASTNPYREVENLLSKEIWEKVLINLCNKTKVKTEGNKVKIQASIKSKIDSVNIEAYKDKYIGEFLKSLELDELNDVYDVLKDTPRSLKSDYKTFLSKIILNKTISNELTWEDFSKNNDRVKNLTENIHSFIVKK
jgi:predicted ATPase